MADFGKLIDAHRPSLDIYESLYKQFHRHPELSTQEFQTADQISKHLKSLSSDLDVRTGIGGTGQIAILKNGDGPTVLLRADIDALPVKEDSGVDYTSKATQVDSRDETQKDVMHACGHDFHFTCLLAAVEALLSCRDNWKGTIVFLFQPAEERGTGAQAMVDDGLYDESRHACPVPDVVLGQHVYPFKAGTVTTKPGAILTAADNVRVTIHGRGGHGSMPHHTIDPVLIAASCVVRLQSIVAREVPPNDTAVLTVGSIRAGEEANIIPAKAVLEINIRTTDETVRKTMKSAIQRVIKGECMAGGCVKEPDFDFYAPYPVTKNDEQTFLKVEQSFKTYFGEDYSLLEESQFASEDFSVLASAVDKPYLFWIFGGVDREEWDRSAQEGKLSELPINHSSSFAPALQPTLRTGVDTIMVAALTFVGT